LGDSLLIDGFLGLVRRIEVIVTDEAKEQPQQIVEETMRTYNVWLNSHLPLNETNRFK